MNKILISDPNKRKITISHKKRWAIVFEYFLEQKTDNHQNETNNSIWDFTSKIYDKIKFWLFCREHLKYRNWEKWIGKDEIQNDLRCSIVFEYFIEQKFTSQLDYAKLAIWHWAVGISTLHYNLMIYINYFFVIPFFQ